MSTNCLITEFKGEVNHNNLPIYNKVIFGPSAGKKAYKLFIAADGGDIVVTSKVPFTVGGTSVTTKIVRDGEILHATYTPNLTEGIADLVTVENYYNCSVLGLYSDASHIQRPTSYDFENKTNLKSFFKYAPVIGTAIMFEDIQNIEFNNTIRHLGVLFPSISATEADSIFSLPNLEVFVGGAANGSQAALLSTTSQTSSSVKQLGIRFKGPLTNLPLGIEIFNGISNPSVDAIGASGSIEEWVSFMRSAGRTSGSVSIFLANEARSITYGGATLDSLVNNQTIFTDGSKYTAFLVWDANNISFASSRPQGMLLLPETLAEYYNRINS